MNTVTPARNPGRRSERRASELQRSNLGEIAIVPKHVERVGTFGLALCVDMILHEVAFTPFQATCSPERYQNLKGLDTQQRSGTVNPSSPSKTSGATTWSESDSEVSTQTSLETAHRQPFVAGLEST